VRTGKAFALSVVAEERTVFPGGAAMTTTRQRNALAIVLIFLIFTCSVVAVAQEKKLYRFQGRNDRAEPKAELIVDGAGNLYGTTYSGGSLGYKGTVFQLVPPSGEGGVIPAGTGNGPNCDTGLSTDS